MKVLHINYMRNDGAGNAVGRTHRALVEMGIDSTCLFLRPHEPDASSISLLDKKINGIQNCLIARFLCGSSQSGYPSINLFPTRVLKKINDSDADVVHLHWIHGEMLSVAQIARIKKPIVWTFHSMWPFLGMYHWKECDSGTAPHAPRPVREAIDRWTYRRKERCWKDLDVHVVCPSNWMAECARDSKLFGKQPVSVIPNCLNFDVFRPLENKFELRKVFGLPANKKVILFGATQPGAKRKGGDLVAEVFQGMKNKQDCVLAVFGTATKGVCKSSDSRFGLETHELGYICDEETMARVYNAADVMCVPSRQDNLPSVCVEAQACGLPVVAFNVGGIPDIVSHGKTGYLASPYDVDDFRAGVEWCVCVGESVRAKARERAVSIFSCERVANLHFELYKTVLGLV